jgi:hypothetical protein
MIPLLARKRIKLWTQLFGIVTRSETVKRKLVISFVVAICVISAIFAFYLFDVLSTQPVEKPFQVSFALMPNQKGFTNETWKIYISNDAPDVSWNVDIFTSYGNQTILLKHFDILRDKYYNFDAQQISGEGMRVDIYWQGGHQDFFCKNQDAVTE